MIRAGPGRPAAPHGGRVLYATQGATDPPTFTLFANKDAAADLPALPRAPAPGGLRPRPDADQAAGPPRDELTGSHGLHLDDASERCLRFARSPMPAKHGSRVLRVRVLVRARTRPEPAGRATEGTGARSAHHRPGVQGTAARHHLRRRPGQPELQRRSSSSRSRASRARSRCGSTAGSTRSRAARSSPWRSRRMPPFAGKELDAKSYCACCLAPIDLARGRRGRDARASRPRSLHISTSPWDWNNNDIVHQCDSMNYVLDAAHAERYERIMSRPRRAADDRTNCHCS